MAARTPAWAQEILARLDAIESAPARSQASAPVESFPVALAKSRTMLCIEPKHYSHGLHKGKRNPAGLFTPNGAEFHAGNGGTLQSIEDL